MYAIKNEVTYILNVELVNLNMFRYGISKTVQDSSLQDMVAVYISISIFIYIYIYTHSG